MANGERGEFEVEVDGTKYLLVPSIKAFCEIETDSNCSILDIYDSFVEKKPKVKEVITIFHRCTDMTYQKCQDLVWTYGVMKFATACFYCISKALTGDKKKDEAVETPQTKSSG